jgi:hypothetical protein
MGVVPGSGESPGLPGQRIIRRFDFRGLDLDRVEIEVVDLVTGGCLRDNRPTG